MNNSIFRIILIVFLCLLGMFVMTTIMTGDQNQIGRTALFGMIGSFLFGVLSPRGGILLMLLLAGYSDLLKRLMVLETRISMMDLTYVLGMAPMALAGVVVACILRKVFSRSVTLREISTFGIATVFLLIGAAAAIRGDGGLKALRIVADYGAFSYLLFVIPILYPSRIDLAKLMKITLAIFLPVALYGVWQRTFGLAEFELLYLSTGLSTEARQLEDIAIRPFSTLNAATSLTMVTALAVIMVLVVRRTANLNIVVSVFLIALFALSCFMTFTRVGWAVLIASLILVPLLRYKVATILMYVGGFAGFTFLIFKSDFLLNNLHTWQDMIYGSGMISDDRAQGLRVVTLSDRFIGFSNMKNPENWTPFGIEGEGESLTGQISRYSSTFSHDAISSFLFRFGYVPFATVIVVGLVLMFILHRAVFRLPKERQRLAQLGLAGVFGALLSLATGGTVFQFPANVFFWLMFCFVLVCIWEEDHAEEPLSEPRARFPSPSRPHSAIRGDAGSMPPAASSR